MYRKNYWSAQKWIYDNNLKDISPDDISMEHGGEYLMRGDNWVQDFFKMSKQEAIFYGLILIEYILCRIIIWMIPDDPDDNLKKDSPKN